MKKKIIAFAALVLCMTVFASSTLAYFTKDDVATNVFTTGGIDINLVEKHNDNGVIVDYPRDPISVMPGTTVSKIVTVENLDERGFAKIEQKNKFCVGDVIEIMKPNGDNVETKVLAMYNEDGEMVESCPHPKQVIYLQLSEQPDRYDILRVANTKNEDNCSEQV